MDNKQREETTNGAEQPAPVFDAVSPLPFSEFPSFDELFDSFDFNNLPAEISIPAEAEPVKITEPQTENETIPEEQPETFEETTQRALKEENNTGFIDTLWQEPTEIPKQKKTKKSKKTKSILSVSIIVITVLTLFTAILFTFSYITGLSLFGYRFYHVHTSTMEPALFKDEMVIVKIGKNNIKENDIVTYRPGSRKNSYLIHRVLKIIPEDENNPASMITQGDDAAFADRTESLDSVIGVCVPISIPLAGGFIEFIRSHFLASVVLLGLVYITLIGGRVYAGRRRK